MGLDKNTKTYRSHDVRHNIKVFLIALGLS